MSYASEVLADSPWGYWELKETAGSTLADSSPNARSMTVVGSPALNQQGPDSLRAISWPAAAAYASTTVQTTASPATLELWVYLAANPASRTPLMSGRLNDSTYDKTLYVDPTGQVGFYVYADNAGRGLLSPGALTLNTWHHIVASVGQAGTKLRIDKVTVASNAAVTSSYTGGQAVTLRRALSGSMNAVGGNLAGQDAVTMAAPAFYAAQLSDARTDAHFDAGAATGPQPVSIAGATANVAVAGQVGVVVSPVILTGSAANVAVAAPVGVPGIALPVVVAGDASVVSVAGYPGTTVYWVVVGTSTQYANDGYNYAGTAAVYFEPPIAEPPAHVRRAKVQRVHQSMSAPVLVNGRPT